MEVTMSTHCRVSVLRRPKTTQEMRYCQENFIEVLWEELHPLDDRYYEYFCHPNEGMVEFRVKVRAKRRNLPTLYDDIIRGDYDHRTWKRHRKKQWKNAPGVNGSR